MISYLAKSLTPSPTVSLDTKVKDMQSAGIPVINLCVGEPDFDTPVKIQKSAINAMTSGYTHYAQVSGLPKLKSGIIDKFYNDNKIKYSPSEIMVGLGSKPLLYLAYLALLNKGDEVIIPVPSWNTFAEQVRICGGKPVFLNLKPPFKLTAKDVEKKITKKTKILLLNSPSNPTGAVIEKKELARIADLAVKNNFYIISDEIYEKLIYEKTHISIASLNKNIKERTITVNGFSKAYAMTGWRMGYAGGPHDVISAMVSLQSQTSSSAVTFIQMAGLTALDSASSVNKMFNEFKKRREYIVTALEKIDGIHPIVPEGAFYVFVSVEKLLGKKYKSSSAWCEALLEKQSVALVPGEAFFYPGYFRLSYASSMDNLKTAIKRIKEFVEN